MRSEVAAAGVREGLLVFTSLLVFCAILFPGVFLRGEIIGPADLSFCYRPWSDHNPLQVRPGYYNLSDQFDEIMPTLAHQMDRLAQGDLPNYTDKIQNGSPMFWVIRHEAKMLPLIALSLLFGFPVGWTMFLVGRLLIGGLFFHLYLRRNGVSAPGAFIASIAFCFSSYVIQNFGITMVSQYCLIPLLLYSIDVLLERRSVLWALLFPVLVHQLLVTGYPTTAAYILCFLAGYGAFRSVTLRPIPYTQIAVMAFLGVVAIGFTAPSLLASADFFSQFDWTYRQNYWDKSVVPYMTVSYLTQFFYGPPWTGRWLREAVYVGVLPLVLAAFGALRSFAPSEPRTRISPQQLARFYSVALFLTLCCTYNFFSILEIVKYIPVLNASQPNNLVILIPPLISVLCAFGFDAIARREAKLWQYGVVAAALGAAVYALVGRVNGDWTRIAADEFVKDHLRTQVAIGVVSLALLAAIVWRRGRIGVAVAVTMLLAVDLVYPSLGWNRSIARDAFYPETPAVAFLKQRIGDDKIFLLEKEFLANTPEVFGLRTVAGRGFFNSRTKAIYKTLFDNAFYEAPTQALFPATAETRLGIQLFDALGLRYVVAPRGIDLNALLPGGAPSAAPASPLELRAYLQPEWNDVVAVKSGQSIEQSFTAARDFKLTTIVPQAHASTLAGAVQLLAVVEDASGELGRGVRALAPDEAGNLAVALASPVSVRRGGQYRVKFTVVGDVKGTLDLRWAKGVDLVPNGTLSAEGGALDGDLRMEVAAEALDTPGGKFRLIYDKDLTIWENTRAFPRAWATYGAKQLPDQQVLAALREDRLDLQAATVLPPDAAPFVGEAPGRPNVVIQSVLDDRQLYTVSAAANALLVVSDNFDAGWQVRVNGKPAVTERANYNMRAVRVPAGDSQVEFVYDPPFLVTGFRYAAAAILFHLLLLLTWGTAARGGIRRAEIREIAVEEVYAPRQRANAR